MSPNEQKKLERFEEVARAAGAAIERQRIRRALLRWVRYQSSGAGPIARNWIDAIKVTVDAATRAPKRSLRPGKGA